MRMASSRVGPSGSECATLRDDDAGATHCDIASLPDTELIIGPIAHKIGSTIETFSRSKLD
jgi:hypothetical protein